VAPTTLAPITSSPTTAAVVNDGSEKKVIKLSIGCGDVPVTNKGLVDALLAAAIKSVGNVGKSMTATAKQQTNGNLNFEISGSTTADEDWISELCEALEATLFPGAPQGAVVTCRAAARRQLEVLKTVTDPRRQLAESATLKYKSQVALISPALLTLAQASNTALKTASSSNAWSALDANLDGTDTIGMTAATAATGVLIDIFITVTASTPEELKTATDAAVAAMPTQMAIDTSMTSTLGYAVNVWGYEVVVVPDPVDPDEDSSSDEGLSGGAIAGIIIGVLGGVALLAGVAFFIMNKQKASGEFSSKTTQHV